MREGGEEKKSSVEFAVFAEFIVSSSSLLRVSQSEVELVVEDAVH